MTPTQAQEQTQYLDFCWLWWALGQPSIKQIKSHFYQGSCLSGSLCKISVSSHPVRGKPQSLAWPISRSLSCESGAPNWGQGEAIGHGGAACAHVCPCHGAAVLQLPPPAHFRPVPIWGTGFTGGLEMGTEPSITVEERDSCMHCTIFSDTFKNT